MLKEHVKLPCVPRPQTGIYSGIYVTMYLATYVPMEASDQPTCLHHLSSLLDALWTAEDPSPLQADTEDWSGSALFAIFFFQKFWCIKLWVIYHNIFFYHTSMQKPTEKLHQNACLPENTIITEFPSSHWIQHLYPTATSNKFFSAHVIYCSVRVYGMLEESDLREV